MLLRTKLEIVGAIAALVVIALVVSAAREARKDAAQLKAMLASQTKIVTAASKDETVRDKAVEKTVATFEETRKRIQTPSEALKALPTVIPLPVPLIAAPVRQESQGSTSHDLPESPGAVVPAQDLKALYDFGVACQECQARLGAMTKDRADDAVKLKAVTEERDSAVKAVKGGTFWKRLKHNAKVVLVSVAVGATAGAVAARR